MAARGPLADPLKKAVLTALLALVALVTFGSMASVLCLLAVTALWWGKPLGMAGAFFCVTSLALLATKRPAPVQHPEDRFLGPPHQDVPVGRSPPAPAAAPAPAAEVR